MLILWGCATTLTFWLTRSSIAAQVKESLIYPNLARWTTSSGRVMADNIETLLNCPMCSGTWITLACALVLHVPVQQAAVIYVALVLTCALYDYLTKAPTTV